MPKGAVPSGFRSGTIQYLNGFIYWIGGKSDNEDMHMYKYDISTLTWSVVSTTNTPAHRYYGGSALHNQVFYLFPGFNNDGATISDISSLDLSKANPTWQVEPITMNAEIINRNSYSIAQDKNLVWVFSGWVDDKLKNDLIYFDLSSWPIKVSTLTDASLNPPARYDHTMNIVNDKLFIFGGRDRTSL